MAPPPAFYRILDRPEDYDFNAGVEGFAQTGGYAVVRWESSAPSLVQAVKPAVGPMEAAGFSVGRVESEESFVLRFINERLERQRLHAPRPGSPAPRGRLCFRLVCNLDARQNIAYEVVLSGSEHTIGWTVEPLKEL